MTDADRALETFITLVLVHASNELAQAHDELYPERVAEHIPLSLTLLYPWIPADAVTPADVDELRSFFAARRPLSFELTRVTEFPDLVVYAVPEPEDDLRETMRALWARYPSYPPYGNPGGDPPPHATLGRLTGDFAITMEAAEQRVGPLLPVRCDVHEATLMQEYERDRYRHRATLPFAAVAGEGRR